MCQCIGTAWMIGNLGGAGGFACAPKGLIAEGCNVDADPSRNRGRQYGLGRTRRGSAPTGDRSVKWADDDTVAGFAVCDPALPKVAGLHCHCHSHSRAGDRRQHDALFGLERRIAEPAAVSAFRAACVPLCKHARVDRAPLVYLNFLDWQRDSRTFSSMAIYRNQDYNFTGTAEAERLSGYMISAGFFSTLGVQPVLGRTFRLDDDQVGAGPVVILGGGLWARKFGSSPDVIGKALALNGVSYTVVGVVPASFKFYGRDRDVYTPIGQWNDPSFRDRRISVSAHAAGRLKPGVPLPRAQAEMDVVARNLAAAFPVADKESGIKLVSLREDLVGNVQPFLMVLLAAVGFLLLIACANVGNLLLARSMSRSREFALRAAIGAGRWRVLRQLVTESGLLACLGGTLGILLAWFGLQAVGKALPGTLPRVEEISLDGRVLLFTLAVSVFAALASGLAPALQGSRVNLVEILKEGGRGSIGARHRLQKTLVAMEVAMALVLD